MWLPRGCAGMAGARAQASEAESGAQQLAWRRTRFGDLRALGAAAATPWSHRLLTWVAFLPGSIHTSPEKPPKSRPDMPSVKTCGGKGGAFTWTPHPARPIPSRGCAARPIYETFPSASGWPLRRLAVPVLATQYAARRRSAVGHYRF
eukprot:355744-Chlamydomonas_euryale.AAC.5